MNLWFSPPVLFAVLVLTSSAPTDDKCKEGNELQLPEVQAMMTGKIHFIMGYTDNHVFKAILNITDSSWVRISKIPDDPKTFNLFESNKFGGKCFTSNIPLTFEGHKTSASVNNLTMEFNLLPSCAGCFAMNVNTTVKNLHHFLNLMQIDVEAGPSEISARSFYLMANRTSLPELDLMRFKDQAKCLGFSGEPDYQHDPEKDFCGEGEGVHMKI